MSDHSELAIAIAKRVRIEARRPREGESDLERLHRQRDAELEAVTLEKFAPLLVDGPVPEAVRDEPTPVEGITIPQAATQPPAGAPPSALPAPEESAR